jgi:hypothetical protein
MKDKIRENAKKYFDEELSGEPLYQDLVIDWLTEFAKQQVKLFAIPVVVRSLPIGDELHKTIDGRYILRCISFPIADKFNTHPEKVTDVVEQIIENLNRVRK